ncbi:MAG TPA: hypothetical protein VHB98_02715 [Chloroflexota bacterium]|jgi:hypothetical protein|nr:hypothetical protein [Chloroflexota bacterium]
MNPLSAQVPGGIALIGSGELADATAEVHRTLMARLRQPIQPAFLDTLAGFESNIDNIDRKASDYFQRNFGLALAVARYRTADESPEMVAAAISAIGRANYILAGPGSPSYGIRLLRESPVWRAILARWRQGALLVFASAAALIVGAQAIPVYEIFKAGHDTEWIPGLDLLGAIGVRAAVVPHWNTASGDGYDTRFCYMGAARFTTLEQQLAADTLVLGIDEYTGLYIGPDRGAEVLGAGRVTIREAGRQAVYGRGARFTPGDSAAIALPVAPEEFTMLSPSEPEHTASGDADILALRATVEAAFEGDDLATAVDGLVTLSLVAGAGLEQSLPGRTELAVQTLQLTLPKLVRLIEALRALDALQEERRALLGLLVDARSTLRKAGAWAAADGLRDRLTALGYVLADTPAGTTWSRADDPERLSGP